MGFFDGLSTYLADPANAARIRGALVGAGQAAAQPYGNLGSIAAGAGQGQMTGLNNYYAQQQAKFGLANDQLGMHEKLGQANFLRQIQGQPPLTIDDIMKGNFGGTPQVPLTSDGPGTGGFAGQSRPQAPMGIPPIPGATPQPTKPSRDANFPTPLRLRRHHSRPRPCPPSRSRSAPPALSRPI